MAGAVMGARAILMSMFGRYRKRPYGDWLLLLSDVKTEPTMTHEITMDMASLDRYAGNVVDDLSAQR